MGLFNIIKPSSQVQTSRGLPAGGGYVYLYEPGTTTFITAFKGADLVVPHSSPIRLSGAGRADIWITRDCDMFVTDRVGNSLFQQLNANPDALGIDAGSLVPNGSFEIDSDGNNIPDGWTLVNEAGSTNAIDTSQSTDGAQSFRFTSSGVGGGSLTTTDFFPVNGVDTLQIHVDIRNTLVGLRNRVRVEWYDISFVSISNTDAYDSTATPLTFTELQLTAVPPGTARFAKLRLIGIDPSVALAGSTYFDRVNVFYAAVVSGVFDNITIQDNEIISTNINGLIDLRPNGTGAIRGFLSGTQVFGTVAPAAGGLQVNNQLTGFGFERVTTVSDLFLDNLSDVTITAAANGQILARIGGVWVNTNRIFVDTADIEMFSSPTAATGLRFLLLAAELELHDRASTNNVRLRFRQGDMFLTELGGIGHYGASSLQIRSGAAAASVLIGDQGLAATYGTFSSTGLAVVGTVLSQIASTNVQVNALVRNSVGGVRLAVEATTGRGSIAQLSNASVFEDNWLTFTRDGAVGLFFNNAEVARTLAAASGGLEANNTLTGAGFERVLTASDIAALNGFSFYGVLNDEVTYTSTTTITYPPEFTWTITPQPSGGVRTILHFEAMIMVQCSVAGTTPGLSLRVDHTGNFAAIVATVGTGIVIDGIGSGAPAASVLETFRCDVDVTEAVISLSGVGSNGSIDVVKLEGVLVLTNNTPIGDLRLGFAQSTSSVSSVVIREGSYFRIKARAET